MRDEAVSLEQQTQNIAYQRKLIQDVANRPLIAGGSQGTTAKIDVADIGNLFDLVTTRLRQLDEKSLEIRVKKRRTNEKITKLTLKLQELSPKQITRTTVSIDLVSRVKSSAGFKIKYRIANAGWQPYYDARLDGGAATQKPSLSLIRRAQITQVTTESWDNVALVLSTARPVGLTTVPDLSPYQLDDRGDLYVGYRKKVALSSDSDIGLAESTNTQKQAEQPQNTPQPLISIHETPANTSIAGFQALYKIPGRFTVDNRGTAKRVKIAEETLKVALSSHAAPVLDPNAYLMAKFTMGGDSPVLPGHVLLFRDNVYMGKGHLPLLVPGEDHELGFGVDDNIKITRSEMLHKTGESGIISTSFVEEKSWVSEIKNLHAKPMSIRILDRMPYSPRDDINVELLKNNTPHTEINVEKKPGVVEWATNLAAGDTQTIRFGYRISRPAELLN